VDFLVANIEKYHLDVKQKVKQMYEKNKALPEKIDDHIFIGNNSHA
jgi:hypothetical protein